LSSKILPTVPATRTETITHLFEAFAAGDLDGALALTTEDIVLDRDNSKGTFRGVARGKDEVRAATAEFRDPIGGMTWRPLQVRSVGRDFAVVETEVGIEGRSSGINVVARGGWLGRFEGELVAEGVLHQSFADALLEARRRALASARLYFVCEAQPDGRDPSALLAAAIAGGVDVIQLREKAPRCAEEMIAFAEPFARAARERGALFFLNDEPALVERCGADGVHVGQDDEPVAPARAAAGPGALVGLSTHSPGQFDAALGAEGLSQPDQISAGPVWETPTKAGRPAAGIELIAHAARTAPAEAPWFAIGGIDEGNIAEVIAAGARRVVVVRAIRDAGDPEAAARALRAALDAPAAI
jgi:thiamine-phosphate pyrophosphorylase